MDIYIPISLSFVSQHIAETQGKPSFWEKAGCEFEANGAKFLKRAKNVALFGLCRIRTSCRMERPITLYTTSYYKLWLLGC